MTRVDPIKAFYEAFCARDGAAMSSLYSDDVEFSDPVFPKIRGQEAKAMWRMLCEKGTDLVIKYEIVSSEGKIHKVRWDACYTFAATGRQVHNKVVATLTVHNGRIVTHVDEFSFWRWAAQALGFPGILMGWTPMLKKRVQNSARRSLEAYMAKSKKPSNGTN